MQQVKIFKGVDNEIAEIERQINRWMRKSGARVLSITGNLASSGAANQGPMNTFAAGDILVIVCLLYTSPSPRDQRGSRMPSSA